MTVDAWFTTGTSHGNVGDPCQDYATSDTELTAVVADGCSSSDMSDVGARIITLAVRRALFSTDSADERMRPLLLHDMDKASATLGLNPGALDASVSWVNASGRCFDAGLYGDGVIVARCPDGLHVSMVEWSGNMPGYLSYYLDAQRKREFIEQSESFAAQERRTAFRARGYIIDSESVIPTWVDYRSAEDGLFGFHAIIPVQADLVAVFSDGVCQIGGVPWCEAIQTLTAFKGPCIGEFVKRRARAALKEWATEEKLPVDDFAMGAVCLM